MFEEAGEVLENMLKVSFPLSLVLFLVLVCPLRAEAAHEFSVYRMQQYDLQGQTYGSRNAILNTEARTVEAEVLSRRCVMMRLADFSYEKYQKALRQSAGAVVIILPHNMSTLPQDIVQQFMELEPELLATETIVPVYFALEDEELLSIYTQTQISSSSQGSSSAAEVLLHTATANGFQMVTSGAQSKAVSDWAITSLEGRLTGSGGEDLPTIVLVAHYDSFGVAPWLSYGADSNGSGVAILLELARLFSRLYSYKRTHAGYNLLFFLSGGGKFNYQGTKRWLEDNLDHTDASLLQDNVAFVLCLDTLGNSDNLHLHVSKPPKEGSPQYTLLKELETVVAHQHPDLKFAMVHKKINLADDTLAWEHERFGIRRLPAFTLSHLESHRSPARHSIMDMRSVSPSLEGAGEATTGPHVDLGKLSRNTKVIAETLARVIYNLTEKGVTGDLEIFTEQMQVQEDQLASLVDWLTAQPRAAQLLDKDSSIINTLEHQLSRYLKDVKRHLVRADKRDPEFVFYDQLKQTMNAYRVKPAIFDLLLAVCIASYLGVLYLAIQNFGLLYGFLRRVTAPRVKQH
ncbi:BOS complex subunit ncln precursor [Danio rerio]|uniref:BOS complex subunit ncln n=1 Tax=Danio rerio TaxID=7955 RepID=NCLN_DANRE|nr:BOS complex subunit ncln precursor [Danio rerio]Q6NZ07.1 RecName: Full=BOS complex subunit ncln; AltName: Full=Nicalin-1; AltName: Full=Nicastrin-like protein 1; Flags: Precursor [Danio rerio]AAH66393.1 Nicalin [Danio rerio]|eukprot:NP_996940.1 nicalin-1 precursor [Danio rerio]